MERDRLAVSHSRNPSAEGLIGRKTPIPKQFGDDVEAQNSKNWTPQHNIPPLRISELEYTVDTRTKFFYLGGWFVLNLTLTIYNKALLQGVGFAKENMQFRSLTFSLAQIPLATHSTPYLLRIYWLLRFAAWWPLPA